MAYTTLTLRVALVTKVAVDGIIVTAPLFVADMRSSNTGFPAYNQVVPPSAETI